MTSYTLGGSAVGHRCQDIAKADREPGRPGRGGGGSGGEAVRLRPERCPEHQGTALLCLAGRQLPGAWPKTQAPEAI